MSDKIGDILVRLEFYSEGDALDFKNTGRAVLLVEDGVASLPLPRGDKGEKGDKGDPGGKLTPDLITDEPTDSEALAKLQARSEGWRQKNSYPNGFFAINKQTRSGFFWTRGGWVVLPDVFGANSEIAPGEFSKPVHFKPVPLEPSNPKEGAVMYFHNGELKVRKQDGTVKILA